jgi:hypothetical protein
MTQITYPTTIPIEDLSRELTKAFGKFISFSTSGSTLQIHPPVSEADIELIKETIDSIIISDWFITLVKDRAKLEIDKVAEEIRSRYLTSAPLQAATYINKARDALQYKMAGYPEPFVPTLYPYVDSEMRAAEDTLAKDAADRILYEAGMYDSVKGASIEFERRKGKINVSNATSVVEVDSVKNAVLEALRGL